MAATLGVLSSESVLSTIESELARLQSQKAATEAALHTALAKKREALAAAVVRSDLATEYGYPVDAAAVVERARAGGRVAPSLPGVTSPLRGLDKAAWEKAIIEDEMAQPLRVTAEQMQGYVREEEAAERRMAAELAVHMTQLAALRTKVAGREASADRRRRAAAYAAAAATAGAGALLYSADGAAVPDSEAAAAAYAAMGEYPRVPGVARSGAASTYGPPGGGGAPASVAPSSALASQYTRLDALERRILQLESGMVGGVGWGDDAGGGYAADPRAEAMYASLTGARRSVDGGTGSPATPPDRTPPGSALRGGAGAAASYGPGGVAYGGAGGGGGGGGGWEAHHPDFRAAPGMPLSIPLLAGLTGPVRMPARAGGGGGGPPRSRDSGRASVAGSTMSRSTRATMSSSTLPPVSRTSLLGTTFTRETAHGRPGDNMRVLYTVSRGSDVSRSRSRERSPGAFSMGSSASAVGFDGRSMGGGTAPPATFLTAVPESMHEDEVDPVDQWVRNKQAEIHGLLREQRVMGRGRPGPSPSPAPPARGRAPGPAPGRGRWQPPPPRPGAATKASSVGASTRSTRSLPPAPRPGGAPLRPGAAHFAQQAERARVAAAASSRRPGGGASGAPSAGARVGARTAVRNATMADFSAMRRDFESQRSAIRADMRGGGGGGGRGGVAPSPSRGVAPSPARGSARPMAGSASVRSVGSGIAASRMAPPPAARGPPAGSGMSRSASVPARLGGGGGGGGGGFGGRPPASRRPPAPSPSPPPPRGRLVAPAPAGRGGGGMAPSGSLPTFAHTMAYPSGHGRAAGGAHYPAPGGAPPPGRALPPISRLGGASGGGGMPPRGGAGGSTATLPALRRW